MEVLEAGTVDASKEKHIPVIEEQNDGILVKVGEIPHPMEEKHYIEWIEVENGNYLNRYYLKPGDKPQASFYVPNQPALSPANTATFTASGRNNRLFSGNCAGKSWTRLFPGVIFYAEENSSTAGL